MTDPGFDFSILSEFRARLVTGGAAERLLTVFLDHCQARGWLKARGRQRTDSTHVLAAVRALNRVELVGETMRHALNILAEVAPDWLRSQVPAEWYERYGHRVEAYRLPKTEAERQRLAEVIGEDGKRLLAVLAQETASAWLQEPLAVQFLRQVWEQQFIPCFGYLRQRTAKELPPVGERLDSPYDPEARYAIKRSTTWTGYKVHLTEVCDAEQPHLITDVQTTAAGTPDVAVIAPIQSALAERALLPSEQVVDSGYVDAALLVESHTTYGIDLIGPVHANTSWQAQEDGCFETAHFALDWERQRATCPQGKTSVQWMPVRDSGGRAVISIGFAPDDCLACSVRARCTRAKIGPRKLMVRPQAEYEALQAARQRETTEAFKQIYAQRAGIEGTWSQGVRRAGLRHARYVGGQKTHLQAVATAVALNVVRLVAWLEDQPCARTRPSRFVRLALAS